MVNRDVPKWLLKQKPRICHRAPFTLSRPRQETGRPSHLLPGWAENLLHANSLIVDREK